MARNWVNRMIEAGRDLIQGMIDGVGRMANVLVTAITDLVNAAIDAVLDALGLGSPSRLFRTFGRYTIQGYINGIASMRPALVREMQATAGAIVRAGDTTGMLNPTIGLSSQGQRLQPGYAMRQPSAPTYNITINNPVPELSGDSVRCELFFLSAGVLA